RRNNMKRITLLLVLFATVVGGVAFTAFASRHAARDSVPIFVTTIPPGYRDWKLISVAHEEGNLNSFAAILGNDVAIKAYREGKLPFPDGAIIRRRATHECSVHGQGLKKILRYRRLGIRSLQRRQPCRRVGAQNLLPLPRCYQRSRPGFHPLRTLMLRITAQRNEGDADK